MAKRSCDACVRRKTRCDSEKPCRPCQMSKKGVECTYLNPVLKRGPKPAREVRREAWRKPVLAKLLPAMPLARLNSVDGCGVQTEYPKSQGRRLPVSVFAPILAVYKSRMYSVWPVLDADGLLAGLENSNDTDSARNGCYILVTALSAATIAQLNLASEDSAAQKISAGMMEEKCVQLRSASNYRERPSVDNVLASFFLHVYHAKLDNRKAAMMYLQEAISFARMLNLDQEQGEPTHDGIIYTLLWVSERGYAIQHGMPISIQEPLRRMVETHRYDKHQRGLLGLAELFTAFGTEYIRAESSEMAPRLSSADAGARIVASHQELSKYNKRAESCDLIQYADFHVTKSWMQTLLWQQAMKYGLLSSHTAVESMTFHFPSLIARDLLRSFTIMSKDHLLPLGRDQIVKSFEVTNTLADVLLCCISYKTGAEMAIWAGAGSNPPDCLHALFQKISPFLSEDAKLEDMLRQKIGQAFGQSPTRVLPRPVSGKTDNAQSTPAEDLDTEESIAEGEE